MKILAIILTYCSIQITASGGLYISFIQDGADVVVTASGSVDVTGATFGGDFAAGDVHLAESSSNADHLWNLAYSDDGYSIANSGSLFTENFDQLNATSFSGDSFGLWAADAVFNASFILYVPDGFTSGTLSGTLTFSNTLLQDFGVIEQTVSWGGSPEQSVTVVPEPASIGLLGLVSGGLFFTRRIFMI
jgi:hypothetical protein